MEDCLFCKIGSGTIPSYTVYEDDHVRAFLDIHPLAKGHTMVIPKVHGGTILDLPEEEIGALFLAVKAATARVKEVIQPDGFTIGINHEIGQAVPHLHVHIIPRWQDDGGGSMHSITGRHAEEPVEEIAGLFK